MSSSPSPSPTANPSIAKPADGYQRQLIGLLGVAAFFEGFDYQALSQLLPHLQQSFGLDTAQLGLLVGVVHVGPLLACFLVRTADRVGRRPVLARTIVGYTVLSAASGLASGPVVFALLQLGAKACLIAEWALSMVVAAEEFPADRRGRALGTLQGLSSLGAVVCAGVAPWVTASPLGWRGLFWVGSAPLLALALWRRRLRETRRFEAEPPRKATSLGAIWRTGHARRLLLVSAIWGLTYVCSANAVTWWKSFAMGERGLTDAQVGSRMTVAAVVAMPLLFAVGRLIDRLGRRRSALLLLSGTAIAVWTAFTARDPLWLTVGLCGGMLGASAVLPLLNALTTELFPTRWRADAFAWSNNLLGRLGPVLLPALAGPLARQHGWGPVVAATAVGPLLALGLVLRFVPETGGRELEETGALEGG